MRALTRKQFMTLCAVMARNYGVPNVEQQFSITPSVEQRLQYKIVEQSEFLGKINVLPVDELQGQNILASASSPVSGRTDTSDGTKERAPKNVLGMEPAGYQLHKTDSDVFMPYETMDAWAKFPNLAERYTGYVQGRIANDRELIGWYGKLAAADTDLAANPLLQDVTPAAKSVRILIFRNIRCSSFPFLRRLWW